MTCHQLAQWGLALTWLAVRQAALVMRAVAVALQACGSEPFGPFAENETAAAAAAAAVAAAAVAAAVAVAVAAAVAVAVHSSLASSCSRSPHLLPLA